MSIRLRQIEVLRARGISRGESFSVQDLAPRLNLISGPNGSGKSTLALAIRQTLWPSARDLENAHLHADWEHDGAVISVDIAAGYPTQASKMPDVGPAERRGRYLLALHEMVAAESDSETEFVERLVRDAMGGFDVSAAEVRLKWSAKPKYPQKLERDQERAEKSVRDALKKQRELAADEARLDELDAAIRDAESAESLLQAVRKARMAMRYEEEVKRLETRMAHFPEAVRAMKGTESVDLARFRKEKSELEVQEVKLNETLARTRSAMTQTGFDNEPPSDAELESWSEWARRLAELERQHNDSVRKVAEAQAVLEKAWAAVSDVDFSPEKTALDREHAQAWTELWKDWATHHVRERSMDAQRSMLDRLLESSSHPDVDQAMRLLARWLRSTKESTLSLPFLIALAFVAVACLLLAWWVAPLFGLGLVVPVALFLWYRSVGDHAMSRAQVESEWRREGIPVDAPEWTEESVVAMYHQLGEANARRTVAHAAQARLDALEDQERQMEEERERVLERVRQLEVESGLHMHERMDEAAWLGLLVQGMIIVDKAREDHARAEGARENIGEERDALLKRLNDGMSTYLDHPVVHADTAAAAVNSLVKRSADWRSHRTSLDTAREDLADRVQPSLAKWRADETELLDRLGLSHETAWRLENLMEQFEEYGHLVKEHMKADNLLEEARAQFASAAEANATLEELASRPPDQLETLENELEQHVARLEELRDRRSRIHANIDNARQGHELTHALEERDNRQAELDARKHEARQILAGQVVAERIRAEAMKRSMPAVFGRAQALLARFTAGALQLEVDLSGDTPRMVAKSDSGVPRSLGYLSVGERVQVLMAVRVAFLEHEEPMPLPLLVDEALGTSDDDRARTIIDTLLQLAADGRQIFYFTAQTDEIVKWQERIDQHSGLSKADWAWIDLAHVRKLESARRSPLPEPRDQPMDDIPAPGNRSHADYLRLLDVPGLRPLTREPGQEHIGHVFEDNEVLYALLRTGVTTIHAWTTLDKSDAPLCGPEAGRPAVRARIAVLDDAVGLWRTGRGRPVDGSVLEESGAVSATHMEAATDLARRMDGEASRILAGLEDGEVSRFHKAKISDLRDWLLDHDYLDPAVPLDAQGVRIQLIARYRNVPTETIDRIVHLLWTTD